MLKEKLESLLNKEYKLIGKIKINDVAEETLVIKEINYIRSLLDEAEPNPSKENIIVSRTRSGQINLVDGYHRLKDKINNGAYNVNCYVLNGYKIDRYNDQLFEFFEKLKGSEIEFVGALKFKVNGNTYLIEENEGCGGCGNGWSHFYIKEGIVNKKTIVKTVESADIDGDEYDLVINGEIVAHVDQGYGNGYYGGDFEIYLVS